MIKGVKEREEISSAILSLVVSLSGAQSAITRKHAADMDYWMTKHDAEIETFRKLLGCKVVSKYDESRK
jgi:hypothetical protein